MSQEFAPPSVYSDRLKPTLALPLDDYSFQQTFDCDDSLDADGFTMFSLPTSYIYHSSGDQEYGPIFPDGSLTTYEDSGSALFAPGEFDAKPQEDQQALQTEELYQTWDYTQAVTYDPLNSPFPFPPSTPSSFSQSSYSPVSAFTAFSGSPFSPFPPIPYQSIDDNGHGESYSALSPFSPTSPIRNSHSPSSVRSSPYPLPEDRITSSSSSLENALTVPGSVKDIVRRRHSYAGKTRRTRAIHTPSPLQSNDSVLPSSSSVGHRSALSLEIYDRTPDPSSANKTDLTAITADDQHAKGVPIVDDVPVVEDQAIVRDKVATPGIINASKLRRIKDAPFKCTHGGCEQSFTAKHNLTNHMNVHLGIKPFKCLLCSTEFTTSRSLKRHHPTCKAKPT